MSIGYIVCVHCQYHQGLGPDTRRCQQCGVEFTIEQLVRLMWAWMIRERECAAEVAKDNG